MSTIHELYGLKSEQLENLLTEYGKLLDLVARIKSGEVDASDVVIQDNGWKIDATTNSKSLPI